MILVAFAIALSASIGRPAAPTGGASAVDGAVEKSAERPADRQAPASGARGAVTRFVTPAVRPALEAAIVARPPASAPASLAGTPAHDAAKFGFAEKGMRGEVLAFFTRAEIPYVRDTADAAAISTFAFFGLQANGNGHLLRNAGWTAWFSGSMGRIMAKAHAAGAKLVVSIVRFSWDPRATAVSKSLLSTRTKRQTLANEVAQAVVDRGADGVNLDFEPIPAGQRAHFTDLTRRVRAALDARRPGLQLTVAITGYHSSYDVGRLVAPGGADAIFLMGYHYAGSWSKIARSTSPMGGPGLDVVETIATLKREGVSPGQLIVGIPYYAHTWPVASGAVHARTTGRGRDVGVAEALAIVARAGSRWDPVNQSTWARWKSRGVWQQIFVDDPRTLARKWSRFQAMGLLGTGMWSIGKERRPGSINATLRKSWLVAP